MRIERAIRFLGVAGLLIVLMAALAAPASASHWRDPAPDPPPVAPVEVDSICLERLPGSGYGWRTNCDLPAQTIVFDGVTGYDFCLGGYADQTLYAEPYWGCAPYAVPVTLTGDGSVDVCLTASNHVYAPWASQCVQAAVI